MAKGNDFTAAVARWRRAAFLALRPPEREVAVLMLDEFASRKEFSAEGAVRCWPSLETLAALLGKHWTNVQANVTTLVVCGMVSKKKVGRHLVYTFEPKWLRAAEEKARDWRWDKWPNNRALDGPAERQPRSAASANSGRSETRTNGSGDLDDAARTLRATAPVPTNAEEAFCRTNQQLIDFGDNVKNLGGLLRSQYRKLRAKGFSGAQILRARDEIIAEAQKIGEKAWWDVDALEEWCGDLARPGDAREAGEDDAYDDGEA